MKQTLAQGFVHLAEPKHPVTFQNISGSIFQIQFVSQKVVRVLFSPTNCPPARWAAWDPTVKLSIHDDEVQKIVFIRTEFLCIRVDYADGLGLSWVEASSGRIFAQDLTNRAYVSDGSGGVFHYLSRASSEVYCGLGERTGSLNLHGRRFRLEGFDSMGYDAERTDPLYKHCPFYLTLSKESGIAYGLFYNNMSRTVVDLGAEIDAFWGSYRYYQAEFGPLDYYLFFGPSAQKVFDGFGSLMGHPKSLPPRYSLGFLASSMNYTEADDAQERIEAFPELCHLYDIPCDALHLSSGYTVNELGDRCVFTWNRRRFPDPKGMVEKLKAHGIQITANVKPWLLEEHEQYEKVKGLKGFVWDSESDEPARVMQWSAGASTCSYGSYIDFTSEAGYDFWKDSVKKSLLEFGIMGCWNDNNEFTLTDDETNTFAMEMEVDVGTTLGAVSEEGLGSKLPKPARQIGAPIQTLLMAQCSHQAMTEWAPETRPFVITRSASPWCHQFAAQTWSGDNSTDWKTIKFNIPMGLSAGLSCFPSGYGHDVGGFAGPKPSPELLQRWVQAGVLNPRFCIHSWNSDNTVTEPWMYDEAIDSIRGSMHFRMRLIPYLYVLQVEFQRTSWPILRPLFWHFQHDVETFELGFEYMLGSCMLVAPVWHEGALSRTLYLPKLLPSPIGTQNGFVRSRENGSSISRNKNGSEGWPVQKSNQGGKTHVGLFFRTEDGLSNGKAMDIPTGTKDPHMSLLQSNGGLSVDFRDMNISSCRNDSQTRLLRSNEYKYSNPNPLNNIFSCRNQKHSLDRRSGWFNFQTGEYFPGGKWVTVEAPIEADLPPVFIPEGGMLPLGKFMHHTTEVPDDERTVLLFPSPLGTQSSTRTEISLIDDDGVTTNHMEKGEYFEARVWMETSSVSADIRVGIEIVHNGYRPAYSVVWVVVATKEWDHRSIVVDKVGRVEKRVDENGRPEMGIPLN